MTDIRKDIGYTPIERSKKRVPIIDYGKSAKADIAKKQLREMIEQLKKESEELDDS